MGPVRSFTDLGERNEASARTGCHRRGVTEGESRNRGTLQLLRECWSYRRGRQSRPFPVRVIHLEHSPQREPQEPVGWLEDRFSRPRESAGFLSLREPSGPWGRYRRFRVPEQELESRRGHLCRWEPSLPVEVPGSRMPHFFFASFFNNARFCWSMSSTLGVSRIFGIPAKRSSCMTNWNPFLPIRPSPMCMWRSR